MTTSISRGRFRVWLTKNLDEPMSRGGNRKLPTSLLAHEHQQNFGRGYTLASVYWVVSKPFTE